MKSYVKGNGAQKLHDQCKINNTFYKILDLNGSGHGEFRTNNFLVPSGNAFGREEQVIRGQGHITNPAQLNKYHNYELPKKIVRIKYAYRYKSGG